MSTEDNIVFLTYNEKFMEDGVTYIMVAMKGNDNATLPVKFNINSIMMSKLVVDFTNKEYIEFSLPLQVEVLSCQLLEKVETTTGTLERFSQVPIYVKKTTETFIICQPNAPITGRVIVIYH
ncbi:MAG: hypothetical protein ACRDAG_01095 [Cetobacterium somerae]|uniref:hypothetical protein n=1 Tax=Cetobacterium somerae TaxID=188913 RepID=UPI003F3A84E2